MADNVITTDVFAHRITTGREKPNDRRFLAWMYRCLAVHHRREGNNYLADDFFKYSECL